MCLLVGDSFSLSLHAPKVDLGSSYAQLAAPAYARPQVSPDLWTWSLLDLTVFYACAFLMERLPQLYESCCWQSRLGDLSCCPSSRVQAPRMGGCLPTQRYLRWLAVAVVLLFLSITVLERGKSVAGAQPVSPRPHLTRSCTACRHFVPAFVFWRFSPHCESGGESGGPRIGWSRGRSVRYLRNLPCCITR